MKELSIEEKAKRYDEAIERAKEINNEQRAQPFNVMTKVFPELKESEDERIRKKLIEAVKGDMVVGGTKDKQLAISWLEKQDDKLQYWKPSEEQLEALDYAYNSCPDTERGNYYEGVLGTIIDDLHKLSEKQGEQKPADKVESFDRYEGLTDFERTLADICIGWIGEELGWKEYIKDNADVLLKIAIKKFNSVQDAPFEQKPAWSEEDETKLKSACALIRNTLIRNTSLNGNKDIIDSTIDWLKSLKERYTWMPSGEQMEALRKAEATIGVNHVVLAGLISDLEKLKE